MLFVVFPLLLLIFVLCVWSLLIWLIYILGCFALGLSCLALSGFLGLGWLFPSYFREVFNYYLFKYFLMVFLFVFFFWDSYDSNVGAFNIVLEVSEIFLISFNSFFFFPLWFIYFKYSIFYFTNPIFCLRYSTICSLQSVFLSHLLHYSLEWVAISFSSSLYTDSLLFLLDPCLTFLASSQSLSPGYLFVIPFWFQDFGSFSL